MIYPNKNLINKITRISRLSINTDYGQIYHRLFLFLFVYEEAFDLNFQMSRSLMVFWKKYTAFFYLSVIKENKFLFFDKNYAGFR